MQLGLAGLHTHLLLLQAALIENPDCTFVRVACRISPFVPTALTVLSGLAKPKGCRKIDATLLAQALGSPGTLAADPAAPEAAWYCLTVCNIIVMYNHQPTTKTCCCWLL
jgi:hypothetical protein